MERKKEQKIYQGSQLTALMMLAQLNEKKNCLRLVEEKRLKNLADIKDWEVVHKRNS